MPAEYRQNTARGIVLQANAIATGVGTVGDATGLHGALTVELQNLAGTGTVIGKPEGSYDGVTWYEIGYDTLGNANPSSNVVAGNASLTRAVGNLTVLGPGSGLIQLLDYYPQVRFNVTTANTGCSLNAWFHGLPI